MTTTPTHHPEDIGTVTRAAKRRLSLSQAIQAGAGLVEHRRERKIPFDSGAAGRVSPQRTGPSARSGDRRKGDKLRLVLVHQLPAVPLSPAGRQLYVSFKLADRKSERAYLKARI